MGSAQCHCPSRLDLRPAEVEFAAEGVQPLGVGVEPRAGIRMSSIVEAQRIMAARFASLCCALSQNQKLPRSDTGSPSW